MATDYRRSPASVSEIWASEAPGTGAEASPGAEEAAPARKGAPASQPAAPAGVFRQLFDEGYGFGFFQAVRLLERYYPEAPPPGETADFRAERILFKPDKNLVFPPSDVKRIERKDHPWPHTEVTVTFMGLYGVASPLPFYFYNQLSLNREEVAPLRDFLDIFNHRFYAYFYRAWKKYRPSVHFKPDGSDVHSQRILSLAGLGTPGAAKGTPVRALHLAGFAGRLASRARNADGLRAILSVCLGGLPVQIEQNVPRWVRIPTRPRLGAGRGLRMTLGSTATIGEQVLDVSGKFRVVIGPMDLDAFQSFLPGEAQARVLRRLVRLYAPDYLDFDVKLVLHTSAVPLIRLGESRTQLGKNTWLGRPRSREETERVVEYND